MQTTLNRIRAHSPCRTGWEKLLAHLGKTKADDEPLHLRTILDSNGLYDVLWCLRAVSGESRVMRLYAVWCARQVQPLMTDRRSIAAIDVSERFANGMATEEERKATAAAADAADAAADAAAYAAAADAAAYAAAYAYADADAAYAAAYAAAAAAAGRAKSRAAQAAELRRVFDCLDAGQDPYPR